MSMKEKIIQKLEAAFSPEYLEVINESANHIGHAGHDGTGDSHFKVVITDSIFENYTRIERQRVLYKVLDHELKNGIHALSLDVSTPKEVASKE